MTSQPTLCWFLMSQAMERSPGSCGHGAASASWCQPPVCWASRPQLSLIPAVSVCLQQTCCASRCVKTPLRAEPDLNKGQLWTSIFQEHFMFYLSRCCFRNHFPSCRAQKQEWRDASIYLTCCLSTKEGAKVVVLKWHGYSHSVADGLSLTYGINADDV